MFNKILLLSFALSNWALAQTEAIPKRHDFKLNKEQHNQLEALGSPAYCSLSTKVESDYYSGMRNEYGSYVRYSLFKETADLICFGKSNTLHMKLGGPVSLPFGIETKKRPQNISITISSQLLNAGFKPIGICSQAESSEVKCNYEKNIPNTVEAQSAATPKLQPAGAHKTPRAQQ